MLIFTRAKIALYFVMFCISYAAIADESQSAANSTIFEISLEHSSRDASLRAEIRNVSPGTQKLLHNAIQHSVLVILDTNNNQLELSDDSSIKQIDDTVYKDEFQDLPPSGKLTLRETSIEPELVLEGYSIKWGPFVYENVKPGTYVAYVKWTSKIVEFYDDATGKNGEFRNVWTGTVKSKPIKLTLKVH